MEKIKNKMKLQGEGSSSTDFPWSNPEKRSSILFIEAIGTAVMTFAFTLSYYDFYAKSSAYLMCFILFFHISGAHFNPATSFAVYLKDSMSGKFKTDADKSNAKTWFL